MQRLPQRLPHLSSLWNRAQIEGTVGPLMERKAIFVTVSSSTCLSSHALTTIRPKGQDLQSSSHSKKAITTTAQRPNLPSLHDFDLHTMDGATDFISTLDLRQRNVLLEHLIKDDRKRKRQQVKDDVSVRKPSAKQLRQMFLFEAVPFVGFGFLDNVIMILCGDYIDMKFGAVLGISTLAAAGFGNLVSDIAGLGTAGYVEAIGARMGLHMPAFTPEQIVMNSVRWASFWGRTLGVTIGCLLGMFPLLFIKTRQDNDEEEDDDKMSEEDAARLLVRVKN